jgi:hypothetical protein
VSTTLLFAGDRQEENTSDAQRSVGIVIQHCTS